MFDVAKLSPAPWKWEAEDGSLLDLCTVNADGHMDLQHHVLSAHRCKSCEKNNTRCLWPSETDADFIALARQAFDVMMRRGNMFPIGQLPDGKWSVGYQWQAETRDENGELQWLSVCAATADDPFTALVKADRWYRERGEQPHSPAV